MGVKVSAAWMIERSREGGCKTGKRKTRMKKDKFLGSNARLGGGVDVASLRHKKRLSLRC